MWKVVAILGLVTAATAILEGPNVCTRNEPYTTKIRVSEQQPYQVKEYSWCFNVPPRCSKYKIKFRQVFKTQILVKHRPVEECCAGFAPDSNGEQCVPVCVDKCVQGKCVAPNTCACDHGFGGPACDISCPPGKWGRNCQNACQCLNGGTCEPLNGECSCAPGWRGEACEKACAAPTFGDNCIETCQCLNGTCDPASGACQCASGFMGPLCEQRCPGTGPCGQGCRCQNHGKCNIITGDCECTPGWSGEVCANRCPAGKWGENCERSCECANGASCHHVSGHCHCEAGYTGEKCMETCPLGTFGVGCVEKCLCEHGAECSHKDGSCTCKPGWMGKQCELRACPEGKYGARCEKECECEPSTTDLCDPWTGACDCAAGWDGETCSRQCALLTYGKGCRAVCRCENSGLCSPVNGSCLCAPGYQGVRCEDKCPSPLYGDNCRYRCDCGNNANCSHETGQCECPPGYEGSKCDRPCDGKTFGLNCRQQCNCENDAPCNPVNGKCICGPGYHGARCSQRCPAGFFGQDCASHCDCSENARGCHHATGQCVCEHSWRGVRCETQCAQGFYGEKCSERCPCVNNSSCDAETGRCECSAGWTGQNCTQPCPPGTYGAGCSQQCAKGPDGNTTCDPMTGMYSCPNGFTGVACEYPCPLGTYGLHCHEKCACKNGADCHHVTGACQCPPGWRGAVCDEACPAGWWGPNCSQPCRCAEGAACRPNDGYCRCPPGYTGAYCTQCEYCLTLTLPMLPTTSAVASMNPRPAGWWGPNCSQPCRCAEGAACRPNDGYCRCPPGYTGAYCTQCEYCLTLTLPMLPTTSAVASMNPRPAGWWGPNCSQPCRCAEGAACRPNDGYCRCPPGYTGAYCTQCEYCLTLTLPMLPTTSAVASMNPRPAGWWGPNCSQPCRCAEGAACRPNDGYCRCPPGYTGAYCTQCEYCLTLTLPMLPTTSAVASMNPCPAGWWGPNCSQPCRCAEGAACRPNDGYCRCPPGYTGAYCTQCEYCLTLTLPMLPTTSAVASMNPCPAGWWGPNCSQPCRCAEGAACRPNDGYCRCPPGYTGAYCTQCEYCLTLTLPMLPTTSAVASMNPCPAGWWGPNCSQPCRCAEGAACRPNDGYCRCPPGYTGAYCTQCEYCLTLTLPMLPTTSAVASMNPCPAGWWGPNCSQPCRCAEGAACRPNDGYCRCPPGYTGAYCTQCEYCLTLTLPMLPTTSAVASMNPCPAGWWGPNCSQPCRCAEGAACRPNDGYCRCPPGYTGAYCTQCEYCLTLTLPMLPTTSAVASMNPCPAGWWGPNCSQPCRCAEGAACRPNDGYCRCPPGYTGAYCTQFCPEGYFGDHCMEPCKCPSEGNWDCHPVRGCVCRRGFIGDNCDTHASDAIVIDPASVGGGHAGLTATMVVLLLLCLAAAALMLFYYRKRVKNLKREIAHVHYTADPATQPEQHFDNPVYSYQGLNRGDEATLLNNATHIHNNLSGKLSNTTMEKLRNRATGSNDTAYDPLSCLKNKDADATNPNLYHSIDEENKPDHVYDEIKHKEGYEMEYDHLNYTPPANKWKPHYQRMANGFSPPAAGPGSGPVSGPLSGSGPVSGAVSGAVPPIPPLPRLSVLPGMEDTPRAAPIPPKREAHSRTNEENGDAASP